MKIFRTTLAAALLISPLAVLAADPQSGAGSAELHQAMQKGASEMQSMPMTGEVDHDFVTAMRKHHQDGIEMAQIELRNGKDPEAKKFAQTIIDTQKKDIAKFDRWLSAHSKQQAQGRSTPER